MKKIILFTILYITISCATMCGGEETQPTKPEDCHRLTAENNQYCCYYEGRNLDTNEDEKKCWGFYKTQIDDEKVKETIQAIEKGTDSHVTKKHSNVKLDCFSFYATLNYFLLALVILF